MNQFGVRRIRRGVPGCTVRYVCGEVSFKKRKRAQSCLFDSAGIRVTVKKKRKPIVPFSFFFFLSFSLFDFCLESYSKILRAPMPGH